MLSLLVTEIVSLIEAVLTDTLIGGGSSGLPLPFSTSGGLLGDGSFNWVNFGIDFVFWLVVLIVLMKVLARVIGKK